MIFFLFVIDEVVYNECYNKIKVENGNGILLKSSPKQVKIAQKPLNNKFNSKVACNEIGKRLKDGVVHNTIVFCRENLSLNKVPVYYFDEESGIWRFGKM